MKKYKLSELLEEQTYYHDTKASDELIASILGQTKKHAHKKRGYGLRWMSMIAVGSLTTILVVRVVWMGPSSDYFSENDSSVKSDQAGSLSTDMAVPLLGGNEVNEMSTDSENTVDSEVNDVIADSDAEKDDEARIGMSDNEYGKVNTVSEDAESPPLDIGGGMDAAFIDDVHDNVYDNAVVSDDTADEGRSEDDVMPIEVTETTTGDRVDIGLEEQLLDEIEDILLER